MLRGINREMFFLDADDYSMFLKALIDSNRECSFELYCYCLMGNHIHLLIKPVSEELSIVMKRICCRFVYRYNRKYHRIGPLFQDRFKSEPVESEEYFKTVLRYIIHNPVKAGLTSEPDGYIWSSHRALTGSQDGITYAEFSEKLFGSTSALSDFLNTPSCDAAMDIDDSADNGFSTNIFTPRHPVKDPAERRRIVVGLSAQGLSVRKISEITSIPKSSVQRIIDS